MSEQITNSKTKIISDCGHMIIFEKAFEMRKLVKEFILKWEVTQFQNQEELEALHIHQG